MFDNHFLAFKLRSLPPWRQKLARFTLHWSFQGTVYLAILYAAGQLAWPYVTWPDWNTNVLVDPADPTISINAVSDIFVLIVFILEAILKILAFGHGLGSNRHDVDDSDTEVPVDHVSYAERLKPAEDEAIRQIFDLFDVDNSSTISEV